MRLVTLPGVFSPISDSRLLAACLRSEIRPGARVADLCTGSGLLAVVAALHGAAATAVDVSRRAVVTARLNARLNGVSVRAVRGDLLAPLEEERFDVIVSNPPYVPAETDATPSGPARAWVGGRDGRAVLDRICEQAPRHLLPGGVAAARALVGVRRAADARPARGKRPRGAGRGAPPRAARTAPGRAGRGA